MIVKLQCIPGDIIIGDVLETKTGFYDIRDSIAKYDKIADNSLALKNSDGKVYEKHIQNSNMLFDVVSENFESELQDGMCHNLTRFEDDDATALYNYAVAIRIKTPTTEDVYITNQHIYLMNDQGETIERIN